jgi:hypothetical protein
MYLFLIIIIIILDAGALFTLVCARFSAVSVDEAMKFIVQTNLIWMIRLKDIMIQVFFLSYKLTMIQVFYLTNLPQSWFQIFFIAMWKKYGTLFLEVHLLSEKSTWPGSLSWFIQKGLQLPRLLCSGVGPWGEWLHAASWMDDMKACSCYWWNLKQKFHSNCSTFSTITRQIPVRYNGWKCT